MKQNTSRALKKKDLDLSLPFFQKAEHLFAGEIRTAFVLTPEITKYYK